MQSKGWPLKRQEPALLPVKWVYSRIAENCSSGQQKIAAQDKQTVVTIGRGERLAFMGERRKEGGAASRSSGQWRLLVVWLRRFLIGWASCWAGRNSSSWWGEKSKLPPLCGLSGIVMRVSPSGLPDSIFLWDFLYLLSFSHYNKSFFEAYFFYQWN